jgi:hypothetical protein
MTDDIETSTAANEEIQFNVRDANDYVIGACVGHVTLVKCEQRSNFNAKCHSTVTTVAGSCPRVTCPRTCVSESSNGVLGSLNISVLLVAVRISV